MKRPARTGGITSTVNGRKAPGAGASISRIRPPARCSPRSPGRPPRTWTRLWTRPAVVSPRDRCGTFGRRRAAGCSSTWPMRCGGAPTRSPASWCGTPASPSARPRVKWRARPATSSTTAARPTSWRAGTFRSAAAGWTTPCRSRTGCPPRSFPGTTPWRCRRARSPPRSRRQRGGGQVAGARPPGRGRAGGDL